MYKLFLCLKFLRRRYLALIAVAAVALCVAMVLIVVSVMDGFLRKTETAAKGLLGEIIVESPSLSALGLYDEFIAELTGRYRLDSDYKLLSLGAPSGGPAGAQSTVVFEGPGQMAQAEMLASGLDLEKPITLDAVGLVYSDGRLLKEATGKVTLSQKVAPAPPAGKPAATEPASLPAQRKYTLRFEAAVPAVAQADAVNLQLHTLYAVTGKGMPEIQAASPVIYSQGLLRIGHDYTAMVNICGMRLPERLGVTDLSKGLFVQKNWPDASFSPPVDAMIQASQKELNTILQHLGRQESLPPAQQDPEIIRKLEQAEKNLTMTPLPRLEEAQQFQKDAAIIEQALQDERSKPAGQQDAAQIARLQEQLDRTLHAARLGDNHMIFGLTIPGLSFRTKDGTSIRWATPGQGDVTLMLLPTGRGRGTMDITPSFRTFSIVDDARTDVYHIDSNTVYVPFETLQLLMGMTEIRDMYDPTNVDPARCSQINIKARPPFDSPARLVEVRRKVQQAWTSFRLHHPNASESEVDIFTWREKLASFIGVIEKQRTLVTIMFGIISFVSVLLIFAIFYMIVAQKTRDIGVIRAVGGSGAGIAQVFLVFGGATGLLGSAIGLTAGWLFVVYINEIQDWLAAWSGFRVWDMDIFMFEKIPNQVDPAVAAAIAAWAIMSGLVAALIPSVRAAVMEPAEAIRYE